MRELDHAADILMSGGTVIFPTDTVLGLGAHALKKDAIEKIYEIKGRDRNKPINILISDIDKQASLVEPLNKIEEKLAETFWPGPLTLILKLKESNINLYNFTKSDGTIGIRIPKSEIAREIIRKSGGIVATTSVNLSGDEPAILVSEINPIIKEKVDYIINQNESSTREPSTVVKVEDETINILRQGALSMSDLESALKRG